MQPEPLVFEAVVDGLFNQSLKGRIDRSLLDRLKDVGIDLGSRLLPAYRLDVWSNALRTTAETLFRHVSLPEAYCQLGQEVVAGVTRSLVGQALAATSRGIGPGRMLGRLEKMLRTGDNFTHVKPIEKSPTHYQLVFNDVRPSEHYVRGVLLAVLRASGARDPVIAVTHREGNAATFDCRWS